MMTEASPRGDISSGDDPARVTGFETGCTNASEGKWVSDLDKTRAYWQGTAAPS
jgi:hypothetical protein